MPLSELSIKNLQCRTYGHAWKPSHVRYTTGHNGQIIEYRAVLVCRDCKTEREQAFNRIGEVVRNRYRYAQKYLKPLEERRKWTKQEARVEFANRLGQEEFEEEEQ